ncbi:isochorismate synthase [Chlorobium limicola DSM 245]|uniref:Isochorismate synthase MenF n=1 Tax=Chlorobium limicola (strain DSM 245 / NBRC 103803 / 6330) TaxID=290315 RepID=B3EG67_CHLL2|nr:isochorismate synthase [Chlorobium limicola]ACD91076.1 isochorismate synthase [Chlorobium limicola DSM 245]
MLMREQQNIIIPEQEPLPIDRAVAALRKAIQAYDPSAVNRSPALSIFRQRVLPADPLIWLFRQRVFPRVFWMNREKDCTLAGIGSADWIRHEAEGSNSDSFDLLVRTLSEKDPAVRYIGGFRFNNMESQDETWSAFPSFSFVLPLVLYAEERDGSWLSCHLFVKEGEDSGRKKTVLLQTLEALDLKADAAIPEMPLLKQASCIPDRKLWVEGCRKALGLFASGEMDKIMLARRTVLEFGSSFSPLLYLIRYPYPRNATFRFCYEPMENHAFISFTPERLYRRDGQMILTEALAGTCLKESMNGNDFHASEILLNSEKDIREHGFVKEAIFRALQPVSSSFEMEQNLRVLQLNRLAHLYTCCKATLKPEYSSDSTVLSVLHPTPAVGGVPKNEAMQHILDLEPFCRGWYAAPVGWISRDSAEFAVGIRSALVSEEFTNLYSGAGLVEGSDPDLEWDEIEQKIGDLMAIARGSHE